MVPGDAVTCTRLGGARPDFSSDESPSFFVAGERALPAVTGMSGHPNRQWRKGCFVSQPKESPQVGTLRELAGLGAIPCVAWAAVHIVRDVLAYRIAREVLRRTPDDQLALTKRAVNANRRRVR